MSNQITSNLIKTKPLFLYLLCCIFFNCHKETITLYVGTYTNGESEGIYQFQFNTETGELSKKQLAATSENPSFIAYSPNKKFIYAVNETKKGLLSAFYINEDKSLSLINTVSANGAHPCHVSLNTTGDKAVVSNYTGGNAAVYTVNNDGSLNKAFQTLNHNTDSVVPHVHSAQFFKDDLYVADLGKNAVYNYKEEGKNYKLVDSSIVRLQANSGPRHFALTNDGKFIYIINELSSTITSAKKAGNGFELIETVSTLANDFKGDSYCADIHLSANQRFVYGSNRGENSIVVFKRDVKTGKLEKTQNISVHGNWPRNFALGPSGKFLLVANQKSDNITVFKIEKETGKLSFLHEQKLPSPVCLLF